MENQDCKEIDSTLPKMEDLEKEQSIIQTSPPVDPLSEVLGVAMVTEKEPEYVTGFKLTIVITSVTLVTFLILLDTSIIATAIPRITSDFHSLPDVGWYGSAYLLASSSLQPLTGRLYTHFSSKYTFLSFLAVFELGSLMCGVAPSSDVLIVGRAVAGLGSSGLINGALTIIAACIPLEKRPLYVGIVMSFSQIGIVLGPLIGGALTQYTTWRWCFYINLPAGGAVAVLLLIIRIPDRIDKNGSLTARRIITEKLDLIGFAMFAPAAIQFLLALEWGGNSYPWNSATIIGLFCGSFGTICIFLFWEYHKGDLAMIPLSIVRQRVVWSSCAVMFFFFGSMMTVSYYLPIYFQAVRNATPTMSGVYVLPTILSAMVFAVVSGVLVGKLGYYLPWAAASGILTSISLGLLSTFTPNTSTGTWIGYQIIGGVGRGCGMQMVIVAIQNSLPPDLVALGMSTAIFSQTFGGAVFLSLAEIILTQGLLEAIPIYAPDVNPKTVISAGASSIRDVVPPSSLDGVLVAYNQAISHVFYLGAGASVGTFIFCWGMGWKSVKKAKTAPAES